LEVVTAEIAESLLWLDTLVRVPFDPPTFEAEVALKLIPTELSRKTLWRPASMAAWPYVLNSPTGRALLKERYKEKLAEMRPFLWIELVTWGLLG
jgi:hypothetical protein